MAIYEWKGFDGKGRKATGVIDADSPREARVKLRRDKVLVTTTDEIRGGRITSRQTGATKGPGFLARMSARLESKLNEARGREGGGGEGRPDGVRGGLALPGGSLNLGGTMV